MALLKYNPFLDVDEMPGMRQLQDSLNRFLSEPSTRPWAPAVDIIETENELLLKMDVPEVNLKDIDIRLENATLTVKGERKFDRHESHKGYHRLERSYGAFARSFALPNTVETENVRAEYHNGVLHVTLPKKEIAKPRTIQVQVSNGNQNNN